jgi:1-deoxy-D-xylulose-5-phosphate synthase
LDEEAILCFAQKGNVIITVEEGVVAGGFGSAVRELLDREKRFDVRFKSIGLPLEVYPVGKSDQIKREFGLDADGLFSQIKDFFESLHGQKEGEG